MHASRLGRQRRRSLARQLAEEAARTAAAYQADEPEPDDEQPLYAARRKIYPQRVNGTYRRDQMDRADASRSASIICCRSCAGIADPNAPSQAVLIDFPNRRFYFFFIEIWPQEVYYLTGLLIIAAMALFLMNAVAGRIWCGYLCPQTVWTDLFHAIERWIEGDRREHLQRDRQPWTVDRIARAGTKHFLWLMIAWWTGGAWVLYFADAPTLVQGSRDLAGAARRLCAGSAFSPSRPMRSPAGCASRSASTCARGRASRRR